jgi:hypothetical protein
MLGEVWSCGLQIGVGGGEEVQGTCSHLDIDIQEKENVYQTQLKEISYPRNRPWRPIGL